MTLHDISDLSTPSVNQGGALSLPIRQEKILLSGTSPATDTSDFHITAALEPFQQYVLVRLPGRGGSKPGVFDAANSAAYQFLINPSEIQVQRQTIDQQSLARSGWQIGVWGEDFVSITLAGKTPGRYFADGVTDFYTPFTESYRNLAALELVYENNGYWFEGEAASSKLQQTVRRIKMHQDVELTVGEFIWSGMFESMDLTEDADMPFLVKFSLTFIAWSEKFRRSTPYPNSIGGEVQRGHVPMQVVAPTTVAPPANEQDSTITPFITDPSTGNWNLA